MRVASVIVVSSKWRDKHSVYFKVEYYDKTYVTWRASFRMKREAEEYVMSNSKLWDYPTVEYKKTWWHI